MYRNCLYGVPRMVIILLSVSSAFAANAGGTHDFVTFKCVMHDHCFDIMFDITIPQAMICDILMGRVSSLTTIPTRCCFTILSTTR